MSDHYKKDQKDFVVIKQIIPFFFYSFHKNLSQNAK